MDRVRLEGLIIEAPIGVYAHERGVLQRLEIDLIVETDLSEAARSDALAHAIDYEQLAAIARKVATERHHALIETVAEGIARRILEAHAGKVSRVFVRVAKPGAVADARTSAVEIWRDTGPT